jgi:hypothetical protein
MEPNTILAPLQDLVLTRSGAYSCIILLLVFGLCILNLLVKFVSSRLESIKLQMLLMKMKMTYYLGPLDNPSHGQPWCCGPLHHLLSAGSSYWIDLSLSLRAVRVITERGELKDGLQEVPKVVIGQGDTSPSQETSVCTWDTSLSSGNKKGYKSPIPKLTHRITSFRVPLHAPMQPFSSLQIKCFRPSAAFILRVEPRILKFLPVFCASEPGAQTEISWM